MINYLKVSFGIFLALAVSRFVPHPPNFTSLIALSFYVPAILGIKYLPALIFSFFITDMFIGFHNLMFFTWGSVIIIAYISNYFIKNLSTRIIGVLLSAVIYFIITNFGSWFLKDIYLINLDGIILAYTLALPFFYQSLISTILFSVFFEILINKTKVVFTKKSI